MNAFRTHDEFLSALRAMIERWCDERRLHALAKILPGYMAINGLTDGWGEFLTALKTTRSLGPGAFSDADWDLLDDLIRWVDRSLIARQALK
jgi:hypothetical protein